MDYLYFIKLISDYYIRIFQVNSTIFFQYGLAVLRSPFSTSLAFSPV